MAKNTDVLIKGDVRTLPIAVNYKLKKDLEKRNKQLKTIYIVLAVIVVLGGLYLLIKKRKK